MPNDNLPSSSNDTSLINKISYNLHQVIITIQEQQPELLLDKYRNINWHSSRNQSALSLKLTNLLSQAQDQSTLLQNLQCFLKALFTPESFDSPVLIKFLETIRQLSYSESESNKSSHCLEVDSSKKFLPTVTATSKQQTGIAILLLDAENIQLNAETEKFLTTVCHCPLHVKIAFANWCSMGKQDFEFHQRSYDLIHVPAGKDNADGKMIAFGSSIHERYPQVQEVLVCSSDKVMTNLCNHLQQNGLIVYRVSQQGNHLKILNSNTGETHIRSILEMPDFNKFIKQIQGIIISEEKTTSNQWFKLSQIAQIYQHKYNLDINEVTSHHYPGKTAKDVLIKYQSDVVIYQPLENPEAYVALFRKPQLNKLNNNNFALKKEVTSKADLEKALVAIITTLMSKFPNNYVPIEILSSHFNKQYSLGVNKMLGNLGLSRNFRAFLVNDCNCFDVHRIGDRWQVGLKEALATTKN
ncbi:MAG: NYN domain-containing protein [Chlorogloeopsis fritschii C42_A2020_084]|uniref:NYN domain-containing protein n=1 Tax=Chlorogloeopsis fritschii TaxID=1124 RepID=UPI0019F7D7F9|nr:NYN domain-containing protein [Chlorogloeopsis fritschii]MBF2006644.1 NYN domain-containing protein [Chlorogloeopsis fritschii C42_A2020_084]